MSTTFSYGGTKGKMFRREAKLYTYFPQIPVYTFLVILLNCVEYVLGWCELRLTLRFLVAVCDADLESRRNGWSS